MDEEKEITTTTTESTGGFDWGSALDLGVSILGSISGDGGKELTTSELLMMKQQEERRKQKQQSALIWGSIIFVVVAVAVVGIILYKRSKG